jgi:hypothetical protein
MWLIAWFLGSNLFEINGFRNTVTAFGLCFTQKLSSRLQDHVEPLELSAAAKNKKPDNISRVCGIRRSHKGDVNTVACLYIKENAFNHVQE